MSRANERSGVGFRRETAGFTLIEILSAMALAVMIMIGLAQVFKMSSEAVSETEATTDAYQQARGALTLMQRDFAQSAGPSGYVWIIPGEIQVRTPFRGADRPVTYRWDTLYLATVGQEYEMGNNPPRSSGPLVSGGAEVVYTYGIRGRAGLPEVPFEYFNKSLINAGNLALGGDPRTIMMVRKAFLLSGAAPSMYTSPLLLRNQVAAPPTDDSPVSPNGGLSQMMVDRWPRVNFPRYRVSHFDGVPAHQPLIHVEPVVNSQGFPSYPADVSWVVADRVSEFFVEAYVWNPNQTPTPGYAWTRSNVSPPIASKDLLWTGNGPRPICTAGVTGTGPWIYRPQANMPPLFRVTMVVHPHNDTVPIEQEKYASQLPINMPKFRGRVFREVFSVNGVLTYQQPELVVGGNR